MNVLTYGTFDTLHWGHIRLLQRASHLGRHLFVGLSTDAFTLEKGKQVYLPYEERRALLRELKCVSVVFAETEWDQKPNDIGRFDCNTLVMGADWRGRFDYLTGMAKIVYLERTRDVSSTVIKSTLARLPHT